MSDSTASSDSPDSLGSLYNEHHGWLQAWLRRRLDNAGDAADLAQDTWLKIIRSGRAPAAERPRAYLVQAAKGLVIDHYRRRCLETSYLQSLAHLPEPLAPSPEERAIVIETLMEIDAMLDGLPGKARQAFLLSQLEGLRYAEIARRLGVSVSSVQKYMMAALQGCYRAQYPT